MPYGFIYITTNNINNKKYIGQRKYDRNGSWKSYLGSGLILKKAIKKYGKENFSKEIIIVSYNQEELNELEIFYINKYDAAISEDYYNIANGGKSGNVFVGKTEEEMVKIRRKMSEANSGSNNPNFGKNQFAGKTEEEMIKIQKKISEAMTGKQHSYETKKKMSENRQDKIPVICITTKKIFGSIKEAERITGINQGNIIKCCQRKGCKSAGKTPDGRKMVWQYYNKDEQPNIKTA